jgi:hypothetical protein
VHGIELLPVAGDSPCFAGTARDGRTLAWVGRAGTYGTSFLDAASGKVVGRWVAPRGFAGGNPAWDAAGVYITTA